MPLLIFTVNTSVGSFTQSIFPGQDNDGSFRLRKTLDFIPPPDTVFTLKQVSWDGGGNNGGSSNKKPPLWISVEFPQLSDELITSQTSKTSIRSKNDGRYYVNDYGVIRFPITAYPYGTKRATQNPNVVNRQGQDEEDFHFEHKAFHHMHVPLGKFHLEEGFLDCVLTPRDLDGRTAAYAQGTNRLVRIKQIQVILEY